MPKLSEVDCVLEYFAMADDADSQGHDSIVGALDSQGADATAT